MEKSKMKEDFMEALDCSDEKRVASLLSIIKQSPIEYPIYMVDSCLLDENSKVRSFPLHIGLNNESMHPYIKDFFDCSVRKFYERAPKEMNNFYRMDDAYNGMASDATEYIMSFLNDYVLTKRQFEKQGKKICELNTLNEYPFLKDYVEYRNHFEKFKELAGAVKEAGYRCKKEEIQELSSLMLEVYEKNIEKEKNKERHIPLSSYEDVILSQEGVLINGQGRALLALVKMEMMKQSETYRAKCICEEIEKELNEQDIRDRLERFGKKIAEYEQGEASSVNANEDIANMTDEQRKQILMLSIN